jgi:hypothetical protein
MGPDKFKGFSKGEKDLYRQVGHVHTQEDKLMQLIEARTKEYFKAKFYGNHMPVPSKKAENKNLFG